MNLNYLYFELNNVYKKNCFFILKIYFEVESK